jgi:hypothetical protein
MTVKTHIHDLTENISGLDQHRWWRLVGILFHMGELISFEQYLATLDQPALKEQFSAVGQESFILVDAAAHLDHITRQPLPACPVIAVAQSPARLPAGSPFDLCIEARQIDAVTGLINRQSHACAVLVQLLRHNEYADITSGLFAESLCYSTLQQSQGFQEWLSTAERPQSKEDSLDLVLSQWQDKTLEITLNRPAAHNAYSAALKDALCASLSTAYAAADVETVRLKGNGPSFCAGGDLSEFGSVSDAGRAHLSRTTRSAAALLANLTCRTEVLLHGACIGAGIEIPSFADHLSAHTDAFFQLPEINMGLVPGAGGTLGITRRIGRQRTALLAISNNQLDAETALEWGLIDEISRPR